MINDCKYPDIVVKTIPKDQRPFELVYIIAREMKNRKIKPQVREEFVTEAYRQGNCKCLMVTLKKWVTITD